MLLGIILSDGDDLLLRKADTLQMEPSRTFDSASYDSENLGKECLPRQILVFELLVSLSLLKGQGMLIKDPEGRTEQTSQVCR